MITERTTIVLHHLLDGLAEKAMTGAPDDMIKFGARLIALAITNGPAPETAVITSMVKMLISDNLSAEPGEGMTTEQMTTELVEAYFNLAG